MRRTAHVLIASGLLVAGCGDNLEPSSEDQNQIASEDEDVPGAPPTPDVPPPRAIEVSFFGTTSSCDAPIAQLEAYATYADDLTVVPNLTCEYHFEDGTRRDGCVIQHEFPEGGRAHRVIVVVHDPATEQSVRKEGEVFVYVPFEAALEVTAPACGLELSWKATLNTGAETHVFVTPNEYVISDDPLYHLRREHTLKVSAAGTYSVELEAIDERATGGFCTRSSTHQVTLVECPHDHEPGCGH